MKARFNVTNPFNSVPLVFTPSVNVPNSTCTAAPPTSGKGQWGRVVYVTGVCCEKAKQKNEKLREKNTPALQALLASLVLWQMSCTCEEATSVHCNDYSHKLTGVDKCYCNITNMYIIH